jgi:MoaA/NifB/PqqE/SkfB family radical SAM enzyme
MTLIKKIKTDKYMIVFDTKTGQEISGGINGNPDPFALEFPSLMDIGIMGHCKNNCKICYQGNTDKPNMKLEDFKRIIDEAKDYITQVALGGKGDPNLHENFKEILEYCRLNNVVPNYTTSGNGLTQNHVDITKQLAGAVAVSLIPENK